MGKLHMIALGLLCVKAPRCELPHVLRNATRYWTCGRCALDAGAAKVQDGGMADDKRVTLRSVDEPNLTEGQRECMARVEALVFSAPRRQGHLMVQAWHSAKVAIRSTIGS